MTVMILRTLFKKHRDRADERWFAMMEQAMLFRPIQWYKNYIKQMGGPIRLCQDNEKQSVFDR